MFLSTHTLFQQYRPNLARLSVARALNGADESGVWERRFQQRIIVGSGVRL
jgi:hypothetical protein